MDGLKQPIPAFYACYLLRSVARHASTYVGSTPNPARRLRQHNGETRGGAVRTSRASLRPWEMTCLVTGFPSKIAALQFEWAWQNPQQTRHIPPDSRHTQAKMITRISPRSGRPRKRSARPRSSLTDRLANLHLLLSAESFNRWPLRVTFYSGDVFRVWQKWIQSRPLDTHVAIEVNLSESGARQPPEGTPAVQAEGDPCHYMQPAITNLDVGYSRFKTQLEKSSAIFARVTPLPCAVCYKPVPSSGTGTLVCPTSKCSSVFHLQCLSSKFLESEQNHDFIVPINGKCPDCREVLRWIDLAQELTIRMRGEREMQVLQKKSRGRKTMVAAETNHGPASDDGESNDSQDGLDLVLASDDEWHMLSEGSDGESIGQQVAGHGPRHYAQGVSSRPLPPLMPPLVRPTFVDDSEDDAEFVK